MIKKKVFWNKPSKKKRLSKRKTLVKELDKTFSLFIRARDKNCVVCGTDGSYVWKVKPLKKHREFFGLTEDDSGDDVDWDNTLSEIRWEAEKHTTKVMSQLALGKTTSKYLVKEIKRNVIQCGHVFSRAAYSTRWDELNAHAQCQSCNFRHEFDPVPYQKWFINKYGQKAYDDLYAKYNTTVKFSDDDFLKMIFDFQDKWKLALEGFYEHEC